METQSVWRRGHFLFDVHHGPTSWLKPAEIDTAHDLVDPNAQQAIDRISVDHGLIYHNPPSEAFNSRNSLNRACPASRRSSIRFLPFRSHYDSGSSVYQGNEFDPFQNKEADLGRVIGDELYDCYCTRLPTTASFPASIPEKRLDPTPPMSNPKASEKRELSSGISDDNYSHKRTRF
ncbi:hypothetical protein BX666DRAFT_2024496 [Dichotomocladium elegans]|nr:hypothetical protein BX666DRAFT_2024496 [Dichotomocladium elegans]